MRSALVVGLLTTGTFAGQRLAQALVRARLERDLYRSTVDALLETDVLSVSRERTQRVVFEGSFNGIQLLGSLAPALASDVLASIAILPVLVATFPPRVLATAAAAMLVLGLGVLVARRLAHRGEQQLAMAYEELAESLLVAVEGRLELVARGAERDYAARFAALSDGYVRRADRVGLVSAWLGRAPLLASAVAIAGIALLDEPSRMDLTTALVTRAVVLAACLPPILGAAVGVQAVARTSALVRPFAHLLSTPARKEGASGTVPPRAPARFELDGVSFRYGSGLPLVLEDVSLVWTAAEPLTLVGDNGAGKSTLLKLLIGLRPPTAGSIRIDGEDASAIDLRGLRRAFAYLPQRPYLGEAHGSLRAAVHMVVPDASAQQIEDALHEVGLLDAIRAHGDADALAMTVGRLSAGQRQRVALARVLLQDPPVVLLDEPDANLDREGIALVVALVKKMSAQGKLVAIAAHTPELAALSASPIHLGAV
jgi:ABC-type bacteriocin/lantibiotic exporter with double-glycine peptidase domain